MHLGPATKVQGSSVCFYFPWVFLTNGSDGSTDRTTVRLPHHSQDSHLPIWCSAGLQRRTMLLCSSGGCLHLYLCRSGDMGWMEPNCHLLLSAISRRLPLYMNLVLHRIPPEGSPSHRPQQIMVSGNSEAQYEEKLKVSSC